jgi:hypothetical protein
MFVDRESDAKEHAQSEETRSVVRAEHKVVHRSRIGCDMRAIVTMRTTNGQPITPRRTVDHRVKRARSLLRASERRARGGPRGQR